MKGRSKKRHEQEHEGSRPGYFRVPLPRDTAQVLHNNRGGIDNFNLLFRRFVWTWNATQDGKVWELKDKAKTDFLWHIVSEFNPGDDALKAYNSRLRASLQFVQEFGLTVEQLEMSTLWRLVVGMGYKGSLEIGITLHHIYGFPYIPATAVKGLTRAWAELVEKADKATVGKIFGSESKNEKATDSNQLGSVLFFDAVPVEWPRLEIDVMNPHYPEYYRDPEKNPPGDWQSPVPIQFLTVAPETGFWFGLASKNNEDIKEAKQWLVSGLKELGIGAKTSAGYGYFKEVPSQMKATRGSLASVTQKAEKTATTNGAPSVSHRPAGSVKAEIIDNVTKPPRVKILEGKHAHRETILPGVQLQNLGLSIGSIIYVSILEQKGKLVKAEYKGKLS